LLSSFPSWLVCQRLTNSAVIPTFKLYELWQISQEGQSDLDAAKTKSTKFQVTSALMQKQASTLLHRSDCSNTRQSEASFCLQLAYQIYLNIIIVPRQEGTYEKSNYKYLTQLRLPRVRLEILKRYCEMTGREDGQTWLGSGLGILKSK